MRIIYLHQYFNTPEMSGGTRSYEMAKRMVAAGHEVHMITSSRDEENRHIGWRVSRESGINIHWFSVPYSNHMSYRQRINAFFSFAKAAKSKAIELEGEIVFATSTPLTIALPAVLASRKNKIPMVFEVRDLWPEMPIAMGALKNPMLRYFAHKLERWAYKNSSAIVALSPGMKQGVVQTGYSAERVAVIPNSSDNTEFKHDPQAAQEFRTARPWLKDKPLLVYTGTFGKVNGLNYMVELAKALKDIESNICILLVGDGAERDQVIDNARQTDVYEKNLYFESRIPKKDIPALLSAATMASNLVTDLPEARANSANKFFDALASGSPIFINHGGWMHDLVNNHKCGLAMWQQPIEVVAKELNSKMNDFDWLSEAGKSARELAEREFDRDKLASQLITVLNAAVKNKTCAVSTIAPGIY